MDDRDAPVRKKTRAATSSLFDGRSVASRFAAGLAVEPSQAMARVEVARVRAASVEFVGPGNELDCYLPEVLLSTGIQTLFSGRETSVGQFEKVACLHDTPPTNSYTDVVEGEHQVQRNRPNCFAGYSN